MDCFQRFLLYDCRGLFNGNDWLPKIRQFIRYVAVNRNHYFLTIAKQTFTCSKSTIETPEKSFEYVKSYN